MSDIDFSLTRRSALFAAVASLVQTGTASAGEKEVITVHKDPTCGCCSGWVEHIQKAGFKTKFRDTRDLDAKRRLGVPDDLAACHTAEVAGYIMEGHVPAAALRRFLAEKPKAAGLAVPGMPIGSPGMEGGRPEKYDVVLFGPEGRRTYMRFIGEQSI
ncbi:MAG: metal-binding protein [Alphaproteobacteria bacterium 13_2_20CM_2_64_7]|nr:MAG: metal-binding protein [Alphaproteobacteria bacterium 13_2_20CM_2_64_7]